MFRFILAVPAAALITVGLFLFMREMIAQQPTILPPVETPEMIITAKRPEPEPIIERKPPKEIEPPDPIDTVNPDPTPNPGGVRGPKPKQIDPGVIDIDGTIGPSGTPIVTYPPQFPERCKAKGKGGVVIVEFDISEQGDVINPRIISSDNTCLNNSVVRAVSRWKYSPKMVDGRPVPQRGVRQIIRFELED
ncbi:MAG: TonB family protein [Pseudomonadota bacterium]